MALVFKKAPIEYIGILATTEKEQGDDLTIDDLEDTMQLQFCITYENTVDPQGSRDELTLSAFDGDCYKYGNKDHRANNREGHKGLDCWIKESNAGKRLTQFNKSREKGLATSGREEEENNCGKEYLLITADMHADDVWSFNGSEEMEGDSVQTLENDDDSEANNWVKGYE
eukprot:5100836-Ditylum_brightwellii.AAC.1